MKKTAKKVFPFTKKGKAVAKGVKKVAKKVVAAKKAAKSSGKFEKVRKQVFGL